MNDTERAELINRWAKLPSETEQERAANAERVVTEAVKNSDLLKNRECRVFLQGSYRNDTNVRLDSDVDVCVCLRESVTPNYTFAPSLNDEVVGYKPASYPAGDFKNDLETALVKRFGRANVTRGNKAFNIKENTYRLTVDAVPCVLHLRYANDGSTQEGISIFPDKGSRIDNWPDQHFDNGVIKHRETKYSFKPVVRIMKNLRNRMAESGVGAAVPIPSFLNECLVWNVPNPLLMNDTYSDDVRSALLHLWKNTETDEACKGWGDVSEMQYLFHPGRAWTRTQVRDWIQAAWSYLEFK